MLYILVLMYGVDDGWNMDFGNLSYNLDCKKVQQSLMFILIILLVL